MGRSRPWRLACPAWSATGTASTTPWLTERPGFRIFSTTTGPGTGIDIVDRHAAVSDSDRTIGTTNVATVVDVDAAATAIVRLATDRELRARQRAAALARARRLHDWRVVVAAYQDLWSELAELRAAVPGVALRDRGETARLDVPDPFAIHRHYPTALLGPNTVVAAKSGDPAADLARLRQGNLNLPDSVTHAFLPHDEVDALLARLASEPAQVAELAADYPDDRSRLLLRTLLWLAKFDLVELRSATERPES